MTGRSPFPQTPNTPFSAFSYFYPIFLPPITVSHPIYVNKNQFLPLYDINITRKIAEENFLPEKTGNDLWYLPEIPPQNGAISSPLPRPIPPPTTGKP